MVNKCLTLPRKVCKQLIHPFAVLITDTYIINNNIVPYPPPSNVHCEGIERNQVVFAWDEIFGTQCSSIQYIISAINCGACPNSTKDTNIVCVYIESDVSIDTNHTCMFAVQTEICGYLQGERSEHVTVHIDSE